MLLPEDTVAGPFSGLSEAAIKSQLDKIVASRHFRASKKYPAFLRFVVESALSSESASLKERTVGIEVFHRAADYDSNADPVVRITAGEVRKRLAQYYGASPMDEVLITLPVGTYMPGFSLRHTTFSREAPPASPANLEPVTQRPADLSTPDVVADNANMAFAGLRYLPSSKFFLGCIVAFCGVPLFLIGSHTGVLHHRSSLEELWSPLMASSRPVIVSLQEKDENVLSGPSGDVLTTQEHYDHRELIPASVSWGAISVALFLDQHQKKFEILPDDRTNYYDLQNNPAVVIGDSLDPWVSHFTSGLKYHFIQKRPNVVAIIDSKAPDDIQWQLDTSTPYKDLSVDYGLLARIYDPSTHQSTIVMAGLGEKGIYAVGRLLRSSETLDLLTSEGRIPWSTSAHIEIVVSTDVIKGISGPPKVTRWVAW